MNEFIIGTSAYPGADLTAIRDAGIRWIRRSFRFPFRDRVGGALTDEYREARAGAQALVGRGMKLLGVTPLVGIGRQVPGPDGHLRWEFGPFLPDWCGPLGSDRFIHAYRETCAWLAADLHGLVSVWQIANELDITPFAGPLDARQACELIRAAARGLKDADPALAVGHNLTAGYGRTYYFLGYFSALEPGLLDYCGLDGYYGTWQNGGPEAWGARIDEVHELTRLPILVNEWGFASAGGVMNEAERASGRSVCELRKWKHTWGAGHTPEGQADFVRETIGVFRSRRQKLVGMLFYRWEDQEKCWQCGARDCPAETAWGLVDLNGRPKPALNAFRRGVAPLLV